MVKCGPPRGKISIFQHISRSFEWDVIKCQGILIEIMLNAKILSGIESIPDVDEILTRVFTSDVLYF